MTLAQTQMRSLDVDEQILKCVDQGLDSVGRHVRGMVYWHLQRMGHVNRTEITQNPRMFVQGLRAVYRGSSTGVESAILQQISKKFGLNCPLGSDLASAILEAKSKGVA